MEVEVRDAMRGGDFNLGMARDADAGPSDSIFWKVLRLRKSTLYISVFLLYRSFMFLV